MIKMLSRPSSYLAVYVNLVLLMGLVSCKQKQEDIFRPATTPDMYGTWTAGGLTFESGGQGASILTTGQVALFNNLKAASYTFNIDGTYVKRSLDSTLSPTTVLTTLERGTFKLTNGQLTLTSQDLSTSLTRNQYYNCFFSTNSFGSFVQFTLSLQATKDQLLKALDEQKQAIPLYGQTRDLLLGRDQFKIDQTLHK